MIQTLDFNPHINPAYSSRIAPEREPILARLPLTFHTKRFAFDCGLRQACTDIICFSHGASSSRKVYRSAFIPGLHDVCMIFEKPMIDMEGVQA